ncbi:MAG TPA: gliding motility-associated C-terminal domain-containing protein [Flavobacteriales bacterium]|nr:gliding motility-associated C-terminal domain-containing protein [Flavobacteriales bacterium]
MRTKIGSGPFIPKCIRASLFTALIGSCGFVTANSGGTIGPAEPGGIALIATPLTYIGGDNVSCFNAADGAIDLEINGGISPYTVQWTGPNGYADPNEDISGLVIGTYTVLVVDDLGATASIDVVLDGPELLTLEQEAFIYNGGNNVSCAGASDGSVDMAVVGGSSPYNISWTDGLGYSATTEDISGIAAGFYQAVVIDTNGCFATRTIELQAPAVLEITAIFSDMNGFNLSCSDGSDGRIELQVQGGVSPYTYAWGNGSTDQIADGLAAGEQTVVVTDVAGCAASATYTLTAPAALVVTANAFIYANGGNTSCADVSDGAIAANISGGTEPYELDWIGPNGYSSTEGTINALGSGNYQLTVTDDNGCVRSVTTILSDPEPISITLEPTIFQGGYKIPCAGDASGAIHASVSGGTNDYIYSWSGPGSFTSDQADIDSLIAGVYLLNVFDGKGCPASASIDLTAPDPLTIALDISDHFGFAISCVGDDGSIDVTISGGTMDYDHAWSSSNGFSSNIPDIGGLGIGSYTLIVTDANGCQLDTTLALIAPEPLQAQMDVQDIVCANDPSGSIDLTVSGGGSVYTHSWTGPNGFISTAEDISGLASGTYTVTVMDDVGCTGEFTAILTAPTAISSGAIISFFGHFELQCANDSSGSFELDPQGGTGPFDVSVSGPNGYSSTVMSNTHLVAGTYQVSISDHAGCTLDTMITLSQPQDVMNVDLVPFVYPSGTNISCFGVADGSIDAMVLGGVAPYTIAWSGPDGFASTQEDIGSLVASDQPYMLVITDDNHCSFSTNVILTGPASGLHADVEAPVFPGGANISCSAAEDGSIDLSVGGGNSGYTYSWSGPNGFTSTHEDITGLSAGTYTATIMDMNGCSLQEVVTLVAPSLLSTALQANTFPGGTTISCNGVADGSINATIQGGVGPLTLTWSGPQGFTSTEGWVSNLGEGTYCLLVTDVNGCTTERCLELVAPPVLSIQSAVTDASCGASIGAVDLGVNGGTSPFTFVWSNSATTQDISDLQPGTYSVIVEDANECSTEGLVTVNGTPAVFAEGVVSAATCEGNTDGSIDLSVSLGTAPFTYAWSNGSTEEDLGSVASGNYGVTVTDDVGCTYHESWTVLGSTQITIDTVVSVFAGGFNVSAYGAADGSVTTAVSGGMPPFTFFWSNGATTESISDVKAGVYTLLVTDSNGCSAELQVELIQANELEMPNAFSPNGDGDNDSFVVHGIEAWPKNLFTVVNRWGSRVYELPNYKNQWEGDNSQGEQLPNGTYFVILTLNDGQRTLQGYVDLRR